MHFCTFLHMDFVLVWFLGLIEHSLGPCGYLKLVTNPCYTRKNYRIWWGTLRSRYGTFVDFDKIYVFCDKCCIRIDKCVFIVVKIKCVNSGKICDKVNFITKLHTFYNIVIGILSKQTQHFIRTHTNITN